MEVTDRFNLLPPSICIICEEAPQEKVIDTLRVHKTGVASALNGRKYVCERCASEFAKLLGFEKGEHVKQAAIDVEFAERTVARIKAVVKEFATFIEKAVDHPGITDEIKPTVKEVYPEIPIQVGGTTEGVYETDDSETPAVPAPAVAKAAAPKKEEKPKATKKAEPKKAPKDE